MKEEDFWFVHEGLIMAHKSSSNIHGKVRNLRREVIPQPDKPEGILTSVCDLEYSDGTQLTSVPLFELVHIDKERKGR